MADSHEPQWRTCPVCHGCGTVVRPLLEYDLNDREVWTQSAMPCDGGCINGEVCY